MRASVPKIADVTPWACFDCPTHGTGNTAAEDHAKTARHLTTTGTNPQALARVTHQEPPREP